MWLVASTTFLCLQLISMDIKHKYTKYTAVHLFVAFSRESQLWNITVKLWRRREKSKYNSLFCWLNHKKCIKHYDWNKQGNVIFCSLMQAKMGFIEEHVWNTVQNNNKKNHKEIENGKKKQQKPNDCRENCEYSAFKWLINGYKVKFGVKTKWYHRIVLPAHKHKHNYTSIIIHSNDPLFLVCCISFSMIISLVYAHRRFHSLIYILLTSHNFCHKHTANGLEKLLNMMWLHDISTHCWSCMWMLGSGKLVNNSRNKNNT